MAIFGGNKTGDVSLKRTGLSSVLETSLEWNMNDVAMENELLC